MSTPYLDPNYRSLLAAVRATPEDDLPRLVLADWLEEYGDSRRAEFIRVQCELERLTGELTTRPSAAGSVRWGKLSDREWELFDAVGKGWGWELMPEVQDWVPSLGSSLSAYPGVEITFRRGFIAEVQCRLTEWAGGGCGYCVNEDGVPTGLRRHTYNWFNGRPDTPCDTCSGTGRVVGRGPRIVREHLVTRFVATDREPATGPDGWHQWGEAVDHSLPVPLGQTTTSVPAGLLAVMGTGGRYPSREAAHDALSAAALAWAAAAAGG